MNDPPDPQVQVPEGEDLQRDIEGDQLEGITVAPAPHSIDVPDDAMVPDTLSRENECESPLSPANACAWAAQADAIVVAHVTSLQLVDKRGFHATTRDSSEQATSSY